MLTICTILTCLAGWALGSVTQSLRLTAASNDMLAQLRLARSEAIKRNGRVAMCKSADGALCTLSGGWHQGWLVFHDRNNNGQRESDEVVVAYQQPLPALVRAFGNLNVAHYVSYAPGGGTQMLSGAFQSGTITVCMQSAGPTEARDVVISAVGRVHIKKKQVLDCM